MNPELVALAAVVLLVLGVMLWATTVGDGSTETATDTGSDDTSPDDTDADTDDAPEDAEATPGPDTARDHPDRPADLDTAVVAWVFDGDSVRVETTDGGDSVEVRLLGINAPEHDECYGDEGLRWMIDNVARQTVGLDVIETDRFGRALAYLWFDDELINLTLVELGLAIAFASGEQLEPVFIDAEDQAYTEQVGLWASDACGEAEDPGVAIVDLEPDPPGPDHLRLDEELVVVGNRADVAVDIGGWTLRDQSASNRYRFPEPTLLEPGDTVTVTSGDNGFATGSPVWANDGDVALLLDEHGNVVSRLRYP